MSTGDVVAAARARATNTDKEEKKGVPVSVTPTDRDRLRHLQDLLFHRNSRETVSTVLDGYLKYLGPKLTELEEQYAELSSKNGADNTTAKGNKKSE